MKFDVFFYQMLLNFTEYWSLVVTLLYGKYHKHRCLVGNLLNEKIKGKVVAVQNVKACQGSRDIV
jgi:hypothetical protein